MKKYFLFIFLIIINFIFTQNSQDNNEPQYIPAYDFNLSVFNDLGQDSIIMLSSLKGNVILLNFWATWCGPCIAEIPEFNDLYNKYNSKGFEILGISVSDNYKQLKNRTNIPLLFSVYDQIETEPMKNFLNAVTEPLSEQYKQAGYTTFEALCENKKIELDNSFYEESRSRKPKN